MGILTFKGGVHPYDGKELSKNSPVVKYLPKGDMVYPLSQHIGAPAAPIVQKGDHVLAGQKIADAAGFVSSPIHASVSGMVKGIEPRLTATGSMVNSIIIENDQKYESIEYTPAKLEDLSKEEILARIKEGGVVGMGGAGFPTQVKLAPKEPDKIDHILVNGAECEPYLTSDYRRMLDDSEKLIEGLRVMLKLFDNAKGYICIEDIVKLSFDGIGLDFIEGKKTAELIEKYGFPKDTVLFAGLVNGKNIWKNHYEKTLNVLKKLEDKGIQTVLSTSCSLQHVPYTLKHENKLSDEYLNYFAFAEEKLVELKELSVLAECGNIEEDERFKTNRKLFAGTRKCDNEAVKKRLAEVTEADYRRLPARSERQQLQKKEFALPKLPTTTIGSFPQTKDVKANRSAFRKGEISEEQYVEFNKKKIEECVRWQEKIGLDVLVHGEYERNDMVEYFGEALGGFLFTEKAWVQSYGTRCVKPPVIWGDVYRKKPITVEWSVYAQSLTDKIMKGMLTGPVTILNWSFPREDITIKESISKIALAIRDEVLDLEANGIKIIQIDEAALREKLPLRKSDWNTEYLDFAIPAFRLTASGVKPETQIHTHMCYSEFTDIIPAIDDMDADVITFEASRSDLQILDSLRENNFETEVGPGVYDIHSPRIPSVEEITRAIKIMLTKIDKDKLWVNPDCGLKTRGVPETEASLKNMVKAAEIIRAEL